MACDYACDGAVKQSVSPQNSQRTSAKSAERDRATRNIKVDPFDGLHLYACAALSCGAHNGPQNAADAQEPAVENATLSTRALVASFLFAVVLTSAMSVAKVNTEEFSQTAIVVRVTAARGIEGAGRRGRVRYGDEFFIVTKVGDKVYDLDGAHRMEPGTYRAKMNGKGNRVQFLLGDKDGKPKRSEWY